ncbi:ribonuclease HII [Gluconacetobacter entanii]|uniref:Ribonuclease HII n=1 Tax=Gluconacetobacter entanii TaxID=108528 RepID=A0ABT3K7C2_9PROT|nr:ribonuclease HII [Gluconacetobacter entanii]MBY4640112.1 ribonuclease HII [Gluconacetobacter entanii]MCW4580905.1 ribonuclease HII [Gluconacetobacter entanii]MCW4584192.1 ribonuclease HII [Gluconacetobacter entanii]MCW4587536.1 ribonuclease HII [Gluconacetobacter entanii]MCW4590932.1 ribonuclease HII [Gluconacetobacter entanii]
MPDYSRERAHGGRVAGVDEVGRGPLAGPVVAAAVMFMHGVPDDLASRLDDSKKLRPAARLRAFAELQALPSALIGVAAASVAEIERHNILRAAHIAMQRAVARLPQVPDLVLVDGNAAPDFGCVAQCVVGGDSKSLSIAAASIVAKVIRDRLMERLSVRWPGYGWERNAGYGTAAHRMALCTDGITPHHRAAFGTVRTIARSLNPSPTRSRARSAARPTPKNAEQPSC